MSIRIKPVPGQRVRGEQGVLLTAEGIVVEAITPFWVRRQNDGEITTAPEPRTRAPKDKE